LKHGEDEWLKIPTAQHYNIWIITKVAMDRLYVQIYGGYVPFDITGMKAFCWDDRQLIIMSRNDLGDLYHEVGHAQFPGKGEVVAEEFRKWCERHESDYTH
jgi:hypothetical protein